MLTGHISRKLYVVIEKVIPEKSVDNKVTVVNYSLTISKKKRQTA